MENDPNNIFNRPPASASDGDSAGGPHLIMGLTNNQFIIITLLVVGVALVLCFIPLVIIGRIKSGELQAYYSAATAEALANPSATPTASLTPTPVTPTLTPTFVLSGNRPRATIAPHTPVAGPLSDGWIKVSKARTLRFEMDLGATGYVARLSGLPGYKEGLSLIYLGADLSGNDNHMVMKGYIMTTLNMDPNKGLEILTVGDKSYVKGPQPMLGAFEDKWYYGPRSTMGATFDSPDLYRGQNLDWAGFDKVGTETLDGKKCDVYQGGRDATFRFFDELSGTSLSAEDSFAQITRAETRIWLCPDGYLHQISIVLEGNPYTGSSQKGGITMRMHFYDMDKVITLAPPAKSEALPPRSYWNVPTPMPTWTPVTY